MLRAEIGIEDPLGAAARDRRRLCSAAGECHQPRDWDVAAGFEETGGGQFLAIEALFAADLGSRRVRDHQDRETPSSRPFDRPLRACRHPYWRMRHLRRLRQYLEVLVAEMLAAKIEPLVGPRPQHDLDGFTEPRRAFLRWHAKGGEFDACEAAAGTPIDAPAGQHV